MTDDILDGDKYNELLAGYEDNTCPPNHADLPQGYFRWMICGASGSGKTQQLLMDVISRRLAFDRLLVIAKNINEPKYLHLAAHMRKVAKRANVDVDDILFTTNDPREIPAVEDVNPIVEQPDGTCSRNYKNVLIIFDDWAAEKRVNEGVIFNHFLKGRKELCKYVYITQSWTRPPIDIRRNCNVATIFTASELDFRYVFRDGFTANMEFHELYKLFKKATAEKYSSLRLTQ